METLCIKGVVFSGKGEGSKFISFPWVKEQIKEKLGFDPYPGTLNLKLTKEQIRPRNLLKKAEAIEISPAKGFNCGKCFKAKLANNLECAIVIPDILNYPEHVIEIIAPTNLRKQLNLKDGDSVEVRIILE